MAGVDNQRAADAQVLRAVLRDETCVQGHEQVEMILGKIERARVVSMNEGDVRVVPAAAIGDDCTYTIGVRKELRCSPVDIDVRHDLNTNDGATSM